MSSIRLEQQWWHKSVVTVLTLASTLGLCRLAGLWPYGERSIAVGLMVFFCLVGQQRLYTLLLGVLAVFMRWRPAKKGSSRL